MSTTAQGQKDQTFPFLNVMHSLPQLHVLSNYFHMSRLSCLAASSSASSLSLLWTCPHYLSLASLILPKPPPQASSLCLTQDVTLDVNLSCRLRVWYSFVVPPVPSETLTSTTERQINLMVVVLTPLPIDLMLPWAYRKSRCAASVHK